jgi:2-keto-3-deoxy-L-rhamnonate aldolase RhmA
MKWIRSRVRAGEMLAGAWLSLGSAVSAEITGHCGFDWILFDLEHGFGDNNDLLHQLQAIEASPTVGIVRVPAIDGASFKRVLDLGPAGLMVPDVRTVDDAVRLVRLARIPPLGVRGAAQSTRASGYGFGYERYVAEANASLLLVAQIESREGVENAEAIAGVDGIDVLFVGPLDLSIDLGLPADRPRGAFAEAVSRVAEAARRQGKVAGVLVRGPEQARDYADLGFTFIAMGSDRGLIAAGMARNARELADLRAGRAAAGHAAAR